MLRKLLIAVGARDESWTTAGYAAMLRSLDQLQNVAPICDCADPAPHCVALCDRAAAGGWICGTAADQTKQRLLEALVSGARPDVVEGILWSPADFYPLIELRHLPRS